MSVEFHGTSNDTCNFYGKMKDEDTTSSAGGTKSQFLSALYYLTYDIPETDCVDQCHAMLLASRGHVY